MLTAEVPRGLVFEVCALHKAEHWTAMIHYEVHPATVVYPLAEPRCAMQRVETEQGVKVGDPDVALGVLGAFTPPATIAAARERAHGVDAATFEALVEALLKTGILREQRSEGEEGEHRIAAAMLTAIARLAEQLAGDVNAMGPYAGARIRDDTRESAHVALRRALGELTRLQVVLTRHRHAFVEEQLARLAPAGKSPRLHLGCGPSRLDGWYNLDVYPAELALNLSWELPFEDESIEYVFLAHLFEHLYKRTQAPRLLREIYRVLAPGGVARIVVPDAECYLRAYLEHDQAFFEMQRRVWPSWAPRARTHLEAILGYLGADEGPRRFGGHKYGYDFPTLKVLLEEAEFRAIVRSTYMGSAHACLRVDHTSRVAAANVDGRYASLFVEACK